MSGRNDPKRRAIGNAVQIFLVQIFFRDGSSPERVTVSYPLGHRRRRTEGIPLLLRKVWDALTAHFPPPQAQAIDTLCQEAEKLEAMPVPEFKDRLICKGEVL